MSIYTTEVRFICETTAGYKQSMDCVDVEGILDECWDKIFNFDFPIWSEDYRKPLCIKILRHFYTREIGLETVGLWKLKLNTKLNEIMPYYNKLYVAWDKDFNPLQDHDFNRDYWNNGTANSDTEANRTLRELYSDTPQGSLENVENEKYLTSATKNTESTEQTTDTTSEEKSGEHAYGKTGGKTYPELLEDYRKYLLNIDMLVIADLEELFMQIW